MWRFRTISFAVILGAILATGASDQSSYKARIGAWNLGADAFQRDGVLVRNIPDKRIRKLAHLIAMLSPDVLALSEIAPDSALNKLLGHLEIAGRCYQAKMLGQTSNLNVAFLHRCHVAATNPRFIPGSNTGSDRRRKALAVDFKVGEFDFVGIVVHLKSGRSSSNRRERDRQVEVIAEFVADKVLPIEKDVLILGDYNMVPGQDASNFDKLNLDNKLRFVTSEELRPRPGLTKVFSHISRSGDAGNLLDGFAIARGETRDRIDCYGHHQREPVQ